MNLSENLLQNGLESRDKQRLVRFIRGLKISYEMPTPGGNIQKSTRTVTGLGGNCIEERYISKTISCCVYFSYCGRKISLYGFEGAILCILKKAFA